MSRNGSGTYSLYPGVNPVVSGTTISSTWANNTLNDLATAMSGSIAADGQTPITGNLQMSTFRHTGVGNAVARTDYSSAGQIQDGTLVWCGTAGGTADAITLTPTPAITAVVAGMSFRFKAGASPNTGPMTVAISGLTAIAIQNNGAACAAGAVAASKWYQITVDATTTACQLSKIGAPTFGEIGSGPITCTTVNASGLITAAAGITITGGAAGAGHHYYDVTFGSVQQCIAGATYDFMLVEPSGVNAIMRVPTGTNDVIWNGGATYGGVVNFFKGADIASANTINLTTATGNFVHITGTTSIIAVTLGAGMQRTVVFDGGLNLTHNATTNNLPGGATIFTAAGDRATYVGDTSVVRCISYTRAAAAAGIYASDLIDFAQNTATTTGSTYGYNAGRIRGVNVLAGTVTVSNIGANYIEVSPAGVVSSNGTGFTTGSYPLAACGYDGVSISSVSDWRALYGSESLANKDVSNGYAGLTLQKINFKNVANTFTSFLTNTNTAARTYTFPDKDMTIASLSDNAFTGTQTYSSGGIINAGKGAAVASATTTSDIWAVTGNTVHITGTTAMTGLPAAPQAGVWRKLIFDGAVLLTNGANFVVQGNANYTTAANDIVLVYADTTTKFYLSVFRAAGGTAGGALIAGDAAQAFSTSTAAQGSNTTLAGSTAWSMAEFNKHKNIVLNGGFTVNQVAYVSAATLASGTYAHDGWKGGASGGDYSFTQLSSNTLITIAANKTLIQVIDANNVQSTTYTLSWTGTATARYAINSATPAGSYAASPITITGQTVGTTMSIEFGNGASTGTLGDVQLEIGLGKTTYEYRPYPVELSLCTYYFKILSIANGAIGGPSGMAQTTSVARVYFPGLMHTTPTAAYTGTAALIGGAALGNLSSVTSTTATGDGYTVQFAAAATLVAGNAVQFYANGNNITVTLSARL